MNRENLIGRLVARKMQSKDKAKVFCVCMAGASKAPRPAAGETARKN